MILLEQVHDVFSEVGHVFADHEADVATLDFLVVDDSVSDCVLHPQSVLDVS